VARFFWTSIRHQSRRGALAAARGMTNMSVHDMEKAEATYSGFMATLKWAIPVIAVIAFIVVSMIAS
jgi:hypothetical protein